MCHLCVDVQVNISYIRDELYINFFLLSTKIKLEIDHGQVAWDFL